MTSSRDKKFLFIGEISKPHGVRGALAVRQWRSGPPPDVKRVVLKHPRRGRIVELTVERWALRPKTGWIIFPKELTTREQSERYRGYIVGVYREDLPPLGPDEFYLADIIGCTLHAGDRLIGTIRGVVPNPVPYPLLSVQTPDGEEKLVPLPGEKIVDIDLEEGRVVVEEFVDFSELE